MRIKLITTRGRAGLMKNLKTNKGHTDAAKKKMRGRKLSRETQNKTGTCPLQIIERLQEVYTKLGRTPTRDEFGGARTAMRMYGTWKQVLEIAGIPYRGTGKPIGKKVLNTSLSRPKYTPLLLLELLQRFYKANDRNPSMSDARRGSVPSVSAYRHHFGTWKKALKAAGL